MRRILWLIGALILLAGCSSAKKVEERARLERCDSLRAFFAEELSIRFDDVRIIPPDSIRPQVKVAAVRIGRQRAAQVEIIANEEVEAETVEEPVQTPAGRREWLPWALLILIIVIVFGARKAG